MQLKVNIGDGIIINCNDILYTFWYIWGKLFIWLEESFAYSGKTIILIEWEVILQWISSLKRG